MTLKQVHFQIKQDIGNNVQHNRYDNVPLEHLRGTIYLENCDNQRKLEFVFYDKEKNKFNGEINILNYGKFKLKKFVNSIKYEIREAWRY